MTNITMKEFCDLKSYGVGQKYTFSLLASEMNVSVSLISKLYNNLYSTKGRESKKSRSDRGLKNVERYLAGFGYKLILGDPITTGCNSLSKENDKLRKEIVSLKAENAKLREELEQLRQIKRIALTIAKNEAEGKSNKTIRIRSV